MITLTKNLIEQNQQLNNIKNNVYNTKKELCKLICKTIKEETEKQNLKTNIEFQYINDNIFVDIELINKYAKLMGYIRINISQETIKDSIIKKDVNIEPITSLLKKILF